MSVERLNINDVIIFKTNREYIGVIKYIGLIYGLQEMAQYVGIELLESIGNLGHSGTINNYSYFTTKPGYGTHCRLRNVIRKLASFEIFALFQRKLIQKNKQIKELESNLPYNYNYNRFKKSPNTPHCTPIHSLIFNNDISTMSKQTDLTFASNLSPQTELSSRLSLTQKESVSNNTMTSKPTLALKQSESIISYTKSDYESFPDIPPVPEPAPVQPQMFMPLSRTTPVEIYKHKKHKKKKHNKKKKKLKRRRNSFSQSQSSGTQSSMEKSLNYSQSAPHPKKKNYINNHNVIKQMRPMNPVIIDQWSKFDINNVNSNLNMKSYEQMLADPIPISPISPVHSPINSPIQPIQPIQPMPNFVLGPENRFMFLGYR